MPDPEKLETYKSYFNSHMRFARFELYCILKGVTIQKRERGRKKSLSQFSQKKLFPQYQILTFWKNLGHEFIYLLFLQMFVIQLEILILYLVSFET